MNSEFTGTGWSFPPEFSANGGNVEIVSGEEDIKQSLQILLSTSLKERMMHPDFGCDLNQFLFEEMDDRFISNIVGIVSRALLMHEARIKVNDVGVSELDVNQGFVQISVDYTVRTTNNRFNLVYPFYVNEASLNLMNL